MADKELSGEFIDVNGMSMYYEEYGNGIPFVLMHGGLGSSKRMDPCIPTLAQQFRVITPDSRAHGRSNNPAGELNYALMADDIAALIEALNLDRPFVGGWSDGGQVALELGMRHPELSRGLIVAGAYYAIPDQLIETVGRMGFEGPGQFNADLFEASLGVFGGAEYFKSLHHHGPDYYKTLASQVTYLWLTDLDYQRSDFEKIKVPTLLLLGDRDEAIPVEQPLHMYKHIANAELAIVPATGHELPYSKPETFSTVILDFLSRHVNPATQ